VKYIPLQTLPQARASFAIYNSPLSELAVMGFEYGYSVHSPHALVLWEAQFGDFANMGQVIIDQFLSAARAKWRTWPALVLLLPHAYEGQGPEHSSARLERFLQLAAEDNLRLVNCTTAAQYFHLLRLQAAMLESDRRPLVLMTPKSLLRHPRAASSLADLAAGSFLSVIDTGPDPADTSNRDAVERLVLCTGKVAIDLATSLDQDRNPDDSVRVAVARVEQLYPFPESGLRAVIDGYANLREVVWLQEEPENMGAWSYIAPHLEALLASRGNDSIRLRYAGRPVRASTAGGSTKFHDWEQEQILRDALEPSGPDGRHPIKIETRGIQNVG
jgi:2-oxoglutarate dehydrogenase E1 component